MQRPTPWHIVCLLSLMAGCGQQTPIEAPIAGTPAEKELVADAMQEMMKPSPKGWDASGDPAESLARLAEHTRGQFAHYQEVEKLIFPPGFVRRVTEPLEVTSELTDNTHGVVRVRYQKKSSIIHPTSEAAEADHELLPRPSAQTRAQMEGPLSPKWEPTTITVEYDLQDGPHGRRWQRGAWKSDSKIAEGDDFLDRVGLP
ncbi:MAG: hypothetical protein K1X71_04455 [Pirellulales bacterium]|nr:hypothetical protein [Pirellulales bacterium]